MILALLISIIAAHGAAVPPTQVNLKLNVKPNAKFVYRVVRRTSMPTPGKPNGGYDELYTARTTCLQKHGDLSRLSYDVLAAKVTPPPWMSNKESLAAMMQKKLLQEHLELEVDSRGRVVKTFGKSAAAVQVVESKRGFQGITFPATPVHVGSTWTESYQLPGVTRVGRSSIRYTGNRTHAENFKVVGIGRSGSHVLVKIEKSGDNTTTFAVQEPPTRITRPEKTYSQRSVEHSSIEVDADNGLILTLVGTTTETNGTSRNAKVISITMKRA